MVNSYQLAVAVCLLPAASLGEILGLKRVYGFGLAVFTVASLACALSPTLGALVGARLLQGFGGACLAALGGALLRAIYPRRLLGSGFALIALAVAVAAAVGPSVAALVLSVATWPWLFLVNVPLGLLALPLFAAVAPAGRTPRAAVRPAGRCDQCRRVRPAGDRRGRPGRARTGRSPSPRSRPGASASALLVWQQRHSAAPLLPLDLLRIPLFALSAGTSMCAYAAQILAYVSLPFLFQTTMHRSAVATGLLVTPWPLLVAVAAPVAGRLTARYPASVLGSVGLAVLAAGLALLALLPAAPSDWDVAWRMGICGLGFGFYQTPNNMAMMTAGPAERTGAASGMVAVARTVGWSLGSALVALIFELRGPGGAVGCLQAGAGIAAGGAVVSVSRRFGAR